MYTIIKSPTATLLLGMLCYWYASSALAIDVKEVKTINMLYKGSAAIRVYAIDISNDSKQILLRTVKEGTDELCMINADNSKVVSISKLQYDTAAKFMSNTVDFDKHFYYASGADIIKYSLLNNSSEKIISIEPSDRLHQKMFVALNNKVVYAGFVFKQRIALIDQLQLGQRAAYTKIDIPTSDISSFAFSGDFLLTCRERDYTQHKSESRIELWDFRNKMSIFSLDVHEGSIVHCAINKQHKYGATCGTDGKACLLKFETKSLETIFQADRSVNWCDFHPNGNLLIFTTFDKNKDNIYLYSISQKKVLLSWSTKNTLPMACRFSSDGKSFVVALSNGNLQLWSITE